MSLHNAQLLTHRVTISIKVANSIPSHTEDTIIAALKSAVNTGYSVYNTLKRTKISEIGCQSIYYLPCSTGINTCTIDR